MLCKIFSAPTFLSLNITLSLLVGCSNADLAAPAEVSKPAAVEAPLIEAQGADATPAVSEPLKIYLPGYPTDGLAVFEPLFEQFTAETRIGVEVLSPFETTGDYLSEMQQALKAGSTEIDVYEIDVIWPGVMAEDALDLSPFVTAAELEAHIPAIIENYRVDGKLVALPRFADAGLLYYRTDLLDKYGFAGPPQTWDDLEEMAAVIQTGERTEGNDEFWGYVWQGANYEGLTCDALEWQVSHGGGRIIEPDGAITVNNSNTIAAFERAAGWVGVISPPAVIDYGEDASTAAWLNGNAVFMRNWPYVIYYSSSDDTLKGRFDITVLPAGGAGRAATLGGWGLLVSKHTTQPEAAARLVQLLTGPEGQKQNALTVGHMPTIEALYRDPDVLAAQPHFAGLLPVIRSAVARPSTVTGAQYTEVSGAYYNHVHRILTGEVTAAEGLANLEAELVDITGFEARMP